MARIRTIKPDFFDDEEIAALSFPARLVFIGLWQQADRAGRLKDRPVRLKARILPFDDVDMDALLNEIASHRFIQRYSVGDLALIQVRTFEKHQTINQKEPDSSLPGPDQEHRKNSAGPVPARVEGKGREGNRKGTDTRASFDQFWAAYPKKKAKDEAQRAWMKRNPNDELLAVMLRALERQKHSPDWQKESGRYIPFPATWLNRGQWLDDDAPPDSPEPWTCPHLDRCANRAMCAQASILERPLRSDVEAT